VSERARGGALHGLPVPSPGPDYGWIYVFPGHLFKTIRPEYKGKVIYQIEGREVSIKQLLAWQRIQSEKAFWRIYPPGKMWSWIPEAHAHFLGVCIREGLDETETKDLVEIWEMLQDKAAKIWERATGSKYPIWPDPIPPGIWVDENGQVWIYHEIEG